MNEVFINVKEISDLNKYFKKDIVSVEELVCALQEEIYDRELKEEEERKAQQKAEEEWWLERKKAEWRDY